MNPDFITQMILSGLYRVRIDETAARTFYGFSKDLTALDSQSEWMILRQAGSGQDQEVLPASSKFEHAWNDRETIFSTPPPFSNINSLEFDGINDHGTLPSSALLQFTRTQAHSHSIWIKPIKSDGQIWGYQGSATNNDGYAIRIDEAGGTGSVRVMMGSGAGNRVQVTYDVDSLLFDGFWHNVVWTVGTGSNAAAHNIYIDGVLQAQPAADNDNLTAAISYASAVPVFGARHTNANDPFQGKVDNMSTWDIELSQAQVNEIYASTCPNDLSLYSFAANNVFWHKIDGSIFNIIDDIGPNANNLDITLINMTVGSIGSDVCS